MSKRRRKSSTCNRCGGPYWSGLDRGYRYRSCLLCGNEPSRAALNPRYADELRAEREHAERSEAQRKRAAQRGGVLREFDERAIRHLVEGAA